MNKNYYYLSSPANYYAQFWHGYNIGNKAYGFCYDDVNNQSASIETHNPRGIIIEIFG